MSRGAWRRFLSVIAASPRACLHRPLWRERLGGDLLAALLARGLLASQGRADWSPCDGACGGQSQRSVLDEPLDDGSWMTICGHDLAGCDDRRVSDDDLTLLTVDPDALRLWLRESLGATGKPLACSPLPGAHGLGQLVWEGEPRDAFLVVGTTDDTLRRLLEERARARTPSVVFVPTHEGLDASLSAHHAPGALVMLEALHDLVSLPSDRLVLAPPRPAHRSLPVREPAAAPYASGPAAPCASGPDAPSAPAPVVATVIDAADRRPLTASAYRDLLARRESFDLFIDLLAAGSRRGVLASVRHVDGTRASVELPAGEAAALVELIAARRPLRPGEFRTVESQDVAKLVERARRHLEGNGRRGKWRFFQTLSGATPAAKSFVFRPPPGLTCAAIVPHHP